MSVLTSMIVADSQKYTDTDTRDGQSAARGLLQRSVSQRAVFWSPPRVIPSLSRRVPGRVHGPVALHRRRTTAQVPPSATSHVLSIIVTVRRSMRPWMITETTRDHRAVTVTQFAPPRPLDQLTFIGLGGLQGSLLFSCGGMGGGRGQQGSDPSDDLRRASE